jgi:ketosteroid isomerase-like protein
MKFRILLSILILGLAPFSALSDEVAITEDLIRSILKELDDAVIQNDYQGLTKYYYSESIVVYDPDPDPKSEKYELGYEDFMPKMKLDLATMQEADTAVYKILSIKVHKDGLSGESITRNTIVFIKNGIRTEVEADIQVRYAVVEGKVKIAREVVELLKLDRSSDS